MIVLDTSILSESLRPSPNTAVMAWLAAQPAASLFTTTLTRCEIQYGVRVLPKGRRRDRLHDAVVAIFAEDFAGRVLAFDSPSADAYADIAATRKQSGRPMASLMR